MPVSDRVNHIARIDAHFACPQLACAYGVHQAVRGLCILRLIRSSSKNFECGHRSRMIVSAAPLPGEPRHHEQLVMPPFEQHAVASSYPVWRRRRH